MCAILYQPQVVCFSLKLISSTFVRFQLNYALLMESFIKPTLLMACRDT